MERIRNEIIRQPNDEFMCKQTQMKRQQRKKKRAKEDERKTQSAQNPRRKQSKGSGKKAERITYERNSELEPLQRDGND